MPQVCLVSAFGNWQRFGIQGQDWHWERLRAAATRRLGALGGLAQIEAQANKHQSFFSSRMYHAVIGV